MINKTKISGRAKLCRLKAEILTEAIVENLIAENIEIGDEDKFRASVELTLALQIEYLNL